MKETAKQKMSDSIEDQKSQNAESYPMAAELPRKKTKSYEEIATTRRLDIPTCKITPLNGRIFAIETSGIESKTDAGIIIPHKYKSKKGEDIAIKDVNRYFVVAWDPDGIPEHIAKRLSVGIEIFPFIPQEAEEWSLPVITDFETGNQFLSIHYNELGGISNTIPEKVEEEK
jgi:hypothetical protein